MTMPKFEPITKVAVLDEVGRELVFNLQKPLYTADQLTEAYEAGKRDASEDIEQAAFEKWLYDKCPSGDVESVQRQWLKSHEYAEFAGKLEQAAQIEMLRKALKFLSYMAQTTGNVMGKDAGLMDGIKAAEQALSTTPNQALEQFAAKVREQCAEMCQSVIASGAYDGRQQYAAASCRDAIRAIKELP